MHGYTTKITQLASKKNTIKEEIMKKHQKKILLELIEKDLREEKEERKAAEKELYEKQLRLEKLQKEREELNSVRKKKLERVLSPIKTTHSINSNEGRGISFKKTDHKSKLEDHVHRNKRKLLDNMKKPMEKNGSHADYMYNRALRNHFDMERVRMEMKLEKERSEMKDVTFKPAINNKSRQIAGSISPFKDRVEVHIERERQSQIIKRAKSYIKAEQTVKSSKSEFKMGKEYHGHMYLKTKKWHEERQQAIDSKRKHKQELELIEMRDRPISMGKESRKILERVASPHTETDGHRDDSRHPRQALQRQTGHQEEKRNPQKALRPAQQPLQASNQHEQTLLLPQQTQRVVHLHQTLAQQQRRDTQRPAHRARQSRTPKEIRLLHESPKPQAAEAPERNHQRHGHRRTLLLRGVVASTEDRPK